MLCTAKKLLKVILIFLLRWCAVVARAIIRAGYYACVYSARGLLHLCRVHEPVTPMGVGSSVSLGQLSTAQPNAQAMSELEAPEGGALAEEQTEDTALEDIEVGGVESMEAGEVELEEHTEESVGEERRDEGVGAAEDNRLDCWEWPHNWEDLDWDEAMWIEDETVSADIDGAVLPDELWG